MSNKTFRFFVTIFLVSIFALCFTLNSSALSATSTPWDELSTIIENEPVEVKEASVKEAWPTFHNEILKSPEGYRFSDKEEADSIEIGPAFRLFEIDNSKAQNSDSKLFSDIIKYDDEWAYILYANGNPKCLMIVIKINGKYILNRGGEPAGHLVKSLKEFKNKVIKENSNIKPIVVYDGNNYLIIGKDDLREWVIPAYPTQELSDMKRKS